MQNRLELSGSFLGNTLIEFFTLYLSFKCPQLIHNNSHNGCQHDFDNEGLGTDNNILFEDLMDDDDEMHLFEHFQYLFDQGFNAFRHIDGYIIFYKGTKQNFCIHFGFKRSHIESMNV